MARQAKKQDDGEKPPDVDPVEADRIRADPIYAAEKIARINNRDKAGNIIPLRWNDGQQDLWRTITQALALNKIMGREGLEITTLKPRQIGVTTEFAWLGFHFAHFHPDGHYKVLVVAQDQDASENILQNVHRFYDLWPWEYRALRKESKSAARDLFEFPNGSSFTVQTVGSPDAARSYRMDFYHFSEVAFYKKPDYVGAALGAAPKHAWIIRESTANGREGMFYDDFQGGLYVHEVQAAWDATRSADAKRAQEGWDALDAWNGQYRWFFPWFADREYALPVEPAEGERIMATLTDREIALMEAYPQVTVERIKWRRWKKRKLKSEGMDPDAFFSQEFPPNDQEAFQGKGGQVFDQAKTANAELRAEAYEREHPPVTVRFVHDDAPRVVDPLQANLRIYEAPSKSKSYVVGADIAEGVDRDYSVATVLDRTDGTRARVVAVWRSRVLDPEAFGDVVTAIAEWYNNAFVVPEATGLGISTCLRIVANRYPYYYRQEVHDLISEKKDSRDARIGYRTNASGKKLLVNHLIAAIRDERIWIPDLTTLGELRLYRNNEGSYEAPSGKHDDCVMALGLAYFGHVQGAPPVLRRAAAPEKTDDREHHDLWTKIKKTLSKVKKTHRKEIARQQQQMRDLGRTGT